METLVYYFAAISSAFFAAAWALSLVYKPPSVAHMKGRQGEARVAKVVKRLGLEAIHDAYLSSATGTTQVDHLVK